MPGANNGAPKIMEVYRIGKATKRPGKERNDIRESTGGDGLNRMLRYCPKCNKLTDQKRIGGSWCCLECTAKQDNPKEREQLLKGDREYG